MQESLSGEVVSLTDPAEGGGVIGPRPGLIKYKNNQNLRVLGRKPTVTEILYETSNFTKTKQKTKQNILCIEKYCFCSSATECEKIFGENFCYILENFNETKRNINSFGACFI